jgi:hypothetical protein
MGQIDRRTFLAGTVGTAGAVALGACSSSTKNPTGTGANSSANGAARPTLRLASGGDTDFPSPFAYMRGGGYLQMSFIYDTRRSSVAAARVSEQLHRIQAEYVRELVLHRRRSGKHRSQCPEQVCLHHRARKTNSDIRPLEGG